MGDVAVNNTILELRGICKKFSINGVDNTVISDIDLSIKENEFVSILGYTGCGKSTLLRMICGFESPDSGEIIFRGKKHMAPTKDIVMVFQDLSQLFPWKTALNNIVYVLMKTQGLNRVQCRNRAMNLLEAVGLKGYENYYPHQMSGGMRQRCAVARAIAMSPKVLLMDEPFSALDELTRRKLQILCCEIHEKYDVTIVFVTHSIEEAITLSDRIVILGNNEGSITVDLDNVYKTNHIEENRIVMRNEIIKYLNEGVRNND